MFSYILFSNHSQVIFWCITYLGNKSVAGITLICGTKTEACETVLGRVGGSIKLWGYTD